MNSTNKSTQRRAQYLLRESAVLLLLAAILGGGLWAFPSSRWSYQALLSGLLPILLLRAWHLLRCESCYRLSLWGTWLRLFALLGTGAVIIVLSSPYPWWLLVQLVLLLLCGIGLLCFRIRAIFLLGSSMLSAYFVLS